MTKTYNFNTTATDDDRVATKRRITADNKYLTKCQVKDVSSVLTDDAVLYVDGDSIPFFAASIQDANYIIAKHIKSGSEKEFKNKTEFKGAGRKPGAISKKSWLGVKNIEMEAAGKEPFQLEDFEITSHKRLKKDEETTKKNIREYIDEYLTSLLFQSGCKSLVIVMGEGKNFRHDLKLPEEYKGNRDPNRPLMLDYAREYVKENYEHVFLDGGIEADDFVQQKGFEGYKHYRKTGKFNIMISAQDKDARGSPCLLNNYRKKGPLWEYPNPWLIESTDRSIGYVEMYDGECKATGLLQKCYQMLTNDAADNYAFYLKFPKEMQPSVPYSDSSFYKDFCLVKTAEDALQKTVDKFYEVFPKGLQYKAFDGTEMDIDTMTWAEMLFSCVHMKLSENDNITFSKLCSKYNIDTSKIVDNNLDLK